MDVELKFGGNHQYTANVLNNLALLYVNQAEYSKAEPLYERALAIWEKRLGPEHPTTAIGLNNLAGLYEDQGYYSKAEPLYVRALSIKEKSLGPEHPDTALGLNNLALLYSNQGEYSKAETLYERALAIWEKSLGSEHPDVATSLNNLAGLYNNQGEYSKARPLYERALAISEKILGREHPDTATKLNNLALLYSNQGEYSKAETLYERALAIWEKSLGSEHPDVATSLNNLAGLYNNQGEYSKARPLYERALSIREKSLGPDHPDTANSLNGLASLFRAQGQYGKAEPLLERALSISEKILGLEHPDTATIVNNLAVLYNDQGDYSKARPLLERALSISEKILGPEHPDVATSLNTLASLYSNQDQYSSSMALFQRALSIREKSLGPEHPDVAVSLNNLAALYQNQGQYSKAVPLYERTLAILEKSLGPEHPVVAVSLNNLAALYVDKGDLAAAMDSMNHGLKSQRDWLIREVPAQSQGQRQVMVLSQGFAWEIPFGVADKAPSGVNLALSTRLNRHGLLLDIQQRQALLSRSSGPQQSLAARLTALNRRLSGIQLSPQQREVLRQQRDDLEKKLYRELPSLEIPELSSSQVAAALPADGVLIEFQRYRPWLSNPKPQAQWGAPRYLALVLKPDGSVQSVQLGEAVPIDQAIAKALSVSYQDQSDAPQLLGDVSRLVLDPLKPLLAGSRQWFLSPDAQLHRVPFAALPSPVNDGQALGSSVQLRLITTGRDLVRFQQPGPAGKQSLVIANPNYSRGSRAEAPVLASAQPQQRSGDLASKTWASLPATATEGDQIASLLGTRAVTDDAATVSVLERSIGPRVLHIASHGFFVADQDIPSQDPVRASLASGPVAKASQGEDPLLRSGIVLAGANNPGPDAQDDGLLTALEATALQLDGTELVVLSACSTGEGELRTGEGLYGLQRALTVAGARSTLLSLWKVDDAATAEFMGRFYGKLKNGEGRSEALAAVQAEFRNGAVRSPSGEDWTRPYYWAAWQLVGDWRPIQGL
ncbi:tetratricopeptide repeat family protein [Cyanobium sp. NS01]|nr:tetratricopeptide repeat family protein [Cyanobium sp. NS01]